jgi:hypothetical protein
MGFKEESVMNRVLAVAVLVVGVLVGYAAGSGRTEAQGTESSNFPFSTGDKVRFLIEAPNRGDESCIIEGFRGSFVICKNDNNLPSAFNLQTVMKVTLISRGER